MDISTIFKVFNIFLLFHMILGLDRDLSCAGEDLLYSKNPKISDLEKLLYRKNPKISDTQKFIIITLKVEQDGFSLE